MKVSELIEKLSAMPQSHDVYILPPNDCGDYTADIVDVQDWDGCCAIGIDHDLGDGPEGRESEHAPQ